MMSKLPHATPMIEVRASIMLMYRNFESDLGAAMYSPAGVTELCFEKRWSIGTRTRVNRQ